MRVALYVIIIFLVYLINEFKIMSHFWIGVLSISGIASLVNDYLNSISKVKKKKEV